MPRLAPWFSTIQPVHHTNSECKAGNAIPRPQRRLGKGGKPPCRECVRLNIIEEEKNDD
jgi:hypothetical protein